MIYLYFDESGKGDAADWVSVCGYGIKAHNLSRFNRAWGECEDRAGIGGPLHMREVYHLDYKRPNRINPWLQKRAELGSETKWVEWRNRMVGQFGDLVLAAAIEWTIDHGGIIPLGAVVEAAHFRSGKCPRLQKRSDEDPVNFAFQETILRYLRARLPADSDLNVGIVIDHDKESAHAFHKWVDKLKYGPNQEFGRAIKSLCFVNDSIYPLIQAADMLAYVSRQRRLSGVSASQVVPANLYGKLTVNVSVEPEVLDSSRLDQLEAEAK